MQPRAPVSFLSFLGPEGRPQNGVFFHLIDKIADFLHNKLFFLIAPRDLHYYWNQCTALCRQIAQIRTPF